jgi:hypothetical protein
MRAFEKHYKVIDLADLWGMSVKVVRKMFADEPGVLKIDRPESVAISVHRRLSN